MINFLIGLVVGCLIGVVIMCCMFVAKAADEELTKQKEVNNEH